MEPYQRAYEIMTVGFLINAAERKHFPMLFHVHLPLSCDWADSEVLFTYRHVLQS